MSVEKMPEEPPSTKVEGAFYSFFVSRDFFWLYLTFVIFLFLVGVAFLWLGLPDLIRAFLERARGAWVASSIVYTSFGFLFVIAAVGAYQLRRYLIRVQELAVDQIASIELTKLGEEDFEEFDRVRRLREEKAQKDFERNLGATFVVESLELRDVMLFPRAEWNLQPKMNVLLGRNGYGKTLILRAMASLLQRDEEASEIFFARSAGSADSAIEARLKRDGRDARIRRSTVRFAESVGKVPLLAIPDSRFLDRSQQIVGPDDTTITTDLRAYGAHHFLHQRPYVSVIQSLLYEICLDYWEHGRTFDRPVFQFFQECVLRLTGFDFRFHSIERKGRTGFEIRVFTEGNQEPLPIQYASQGTLSVLAMFGLIRSYLGTLTGKPDDGPVQRGSAIVLIDEADAHLHPTWQQKVPSLLKDLFPDVQFILSAHSPLFVAGCWAGEVAVLRRAKPGSPDSGFTVEQLDRDFVGATSAEIYEQIFDIEELDDTYLEYATKASLNVEPRRLKELGERRESKVGLSKEEEEEFQRLLEESRRIQRALEVKRRRSRESDKDIRIDELESEILKLKIQLANKTSEARR